MEVSQSFRRESSNMISTLSSVSLESKKAAVILMLPTHPHREKERERERERERDREREKPVNLEIIMPLYCLTMMLPTSNGGTSLWIRDSWIDSFGKFSGRARGIESLTEEWILFKELHVFILEYKEQKEDAFPNCLSTLLSCLILSDIIFY
jgi:hypothetical protein